MISTKPKEISRKLYKTKSNQNPGFMIDICRFHKSSYTLRNEPFSLKTRLHFPEFKLRRALHLKQFQDIKPYCLK